MAKLRALMKLLVAVVCLAWAQLENVEGANILGFFSALSPSHYIIDIALMKGLAAKGHNITIVSGFPSDKNAKLPSNYHEIYLDLDDGADINQYLADAVKKPGESATAVWKLFPLLLSMMTNRSDTVMSNQRFQQFLHSGQKFDLVVFGWFINDYMLGVAGHFRCPSVIVSTIPAIKSLRDYTGNPAGVSSVPFMPRPNSQQRMSFFGRVLNFIVYVIEYCICNLLYWLVYVPQYEKHFPVSQNYPSFEEVQRNVSLVLVNNHFSQGGVRPLLPNVVEVGGLQIKEKPDPLEMDLQNFLDSASEHGAILFSLGSNAKLMNVNPEKLVILFRVFAKLKQKVIMKFETDEIPAGKPSNVLTRKWLPQDDILAHPNVRLFISHCGLSSVNEARYHGVPILGVPLFGDQLKNIKQIASQGWAVELPFNDMTEVTLTNALTEILSNKIYSENVERISLLYRDRPLSALDTAVFWVEYVLRHNGGRHMQSEAVHLNVIQKQSIDVLAFLIAVVYISWKLTILIIKKIVRRFKCQKKIKKK